MYGSKNKTQRVMYLKEMNGLLVKILLIILSSIVNIVIAYLYIHLIRKRMFVLILNNIFLWPPKLWGDTWEGGLLPWFEFASHFPLIAYFVSHYKWVHGTKSVCLRHNHLRWVLGWFYTRHGPILRAVLILKHEALNPGQIHQKIWSPTLSHEV